MNIKNSIGLHKLGMAMAVALMLSAAAFGQQLGKLGQIQRENAEKLREYSWKMRTEIATGGEIKVVRLDQVRYAVDGTLQQTQLSVTAPELPTGGLRGMIAKKKKKQFTELVDGLTTLAKAYGKLSPEKMQLFIETASITPESTAKGMLMRISGTDVLTAGDAMNIWIYPVGKIQRKIEVRTRFEGKVVRIVSEFKELTGGPSYVARVVIDSPDDELVITTDNFDHVRQETMGGVGRR